MTKNGGARGDGMKKSRDDGETKKSGTTIKWTEVVKKFPEANILQSPEYGKMNEILGDKTVTLDFDGQGWGLLIVRNAKRGRYLEVPCGPLIDWKDRKVVRMAMAKITEVAKREKCVFVRLRPQLMATEENLALLEELGLKKSPMHLAAEHTVMIDLTPSLDDLLAGMRRQTRYEVRRAGKLGIEVSVSRDEEAFREFHQVQLETAKRQGFVPPKLETLLAEREAFNKDATIYTARTAEGEAVAYGLILRAGQEGDYYEAASTPLNRKLPGADAVIWQALQDLKAEKFTRFNLWGIAPEGEPHHRYAGVTTFKKGFGGEVVQFVPAHDLVISPTKYAANWVVETARRKRRHLE